MITLPKQAGKSTTRRKRFFKILKITVVLYIVIGVGLYFFQEKLLFHPVKLDDGHVYAINVPFKEINLLVNKDKTLAIVQFTVKDSAKGVVLYFHGNRRNIERYAPFAVNFTRNNYEVWMMDYPGFGKTTGERTEDAIDKDALELYKMALARFPADRIVIYGKSLGTGPASFLASRKNCRQLILESPYYSIDALVGHYAFIYPVSQFTRFHFPSYQYFEDISAPITIFHGTDDEVIPFSHAKRLQAIAKHGELVSLEEGKHNNLNSFPLYQHKLDSLLAQ